MAHSNWEMVGGDLTLAVPVKMGVLDFPDSPVVKNRLPMQGTQVQSLVWADPTCHGAVSP